MHKIQEQLKLIRPWPAFYQYELMLFSFYFLCFNRSHNKLMFAYSLQSHKSSFGVKIGGFSDPGSLFTEYDEDFSLLELFFPFAFLGAALALGVVLDLAFDVFLPLDAFAVVGKEALFGAAGFSENSPPSSSVDSFSCD
jgi:hypothetical protein